MLEQIINIMSSPSELVSATIGAVAVFSFASGWIACTKLMLENAKLSLEKEITTQKSFFERELDTQRKSYNAQIEILGSSLIEANARIQTLEKTMERRTDQIIYNKNPN